MNNKSKFKERNETHTPGVNINNNTMDTNKILIVMFHAEQKVNMCM